MDKKIPTLVLPGEEEAVKTGGKEGYGVRLVSGLVGVLVPVCRKLNNSVLIGVVAGELNNVSYDLFGSFSGLFVALSCSSSLLLNGRLLAGSERKNHTENEDERKKAGQKLFHGFFSLCKKIFIFHIYFKIPYRKCDLLFASPDLRREK